MDDFVVFHCIGKPCKNTARFLLKFVLDYQKQNPDLELRYTCIACAAWFSRSIDGCEGTKQLSLPTGNDP
jgi:hypothetical protein